MTDLMDLSNVALDGVVVLDLSRVVAGPYAAMLLADMGATVIKVETPRGGDDARYFGPLIEGESPYFMTLNRNKKSITLNLKEPEGKEVLKALAAKAHIIIENFRPGVMERLGFGYEDLKKINPAIVYGSISGFGQYGPYRDRAGYDILGQAMSGFMSITGWPGGKPTRANTALGDVLGGLSLAVGLLGAYSRSVKTGIGQQVDVSLVDAAVSCLCTINHMYLATGELPSLQGNRDSVIAPYSSYECSDGDLVIACGNDKLFKQLLLLMDRSDLLEDPRFATNEERIRNNDQLQEVIEGWLRDKPQQEAVEQILKAGIPAGPIYTIDQVVADPHIGGAREMFPAFLHEKLGEVKITGSQLKMSATPTGIRLGPPGLGEHNSEVLRDLLGFSEEEIKQLEKAGVI